MLVFKALPLLSLAGLVDATWVKPTPVCGTVTETCTRTKTVAGGTPTTVTKTIGAYCYQTTTKTVADCESTIYKTSTAWVTKTPTKYAQADPTSTVTRTACVATKTVCVDHWKKSDIPTDMPNAKRMELGLPPRAPAGKEERWFWPPPPPGPSCTPCTVTTTSWATKTTASEVCKYTTTCKLTKTVVSTVPGPTYTKTATCTSTSLAPPVTITTPCPYPATTTVKTTATVTKRCWWK